MSANIYKRLNVSDTFVVPYTANKSWDISSSSFAESRIVVNIGVNKSGSIFDPNVEYVTNGQYERLVYNSINLSYYPNFLPTSSQLYLSERINSYYNDGTLTTQSYYNGFVNPGNLDTVKFFPTNSNDVIYVLNIPKTLTSDKILPTTFEVFFSSGSTYTAKIYDDGNYNLFYSGSPVASSLGTTLTNGAYIGNIFYEQNVAILTIIPNTIRLTGWRGANPYCIQTSPSPTPTVTPSISVTPSVTPSISVTPSVTSSPGASVSVTPSVSITPSITITPSVTPTATISSTPSPTISVTPSMTPTITPSPSTQVIRLDWATGPGNGGAGILQVQNANGTQVLNETTIATSKSGTLYFTPSEVPFSITGSWGAGSGNIVRYRVCNITNLSELYYSGDIDNMVVSLSYLVDPTPLHTSVELTSGTGATPLACPI
jgi:hypothetical protein